MGITRQILTLISLLTTAFSINAQIGREAWVDYKNAAYEKVDNHEDDDAVIIFDRTYYETIAKGEKVEMITTIHRKIKINSLYGLRQFNKLYIPTYKDLHFQIEFINCKAKTLKRNKKSVTTDTSSFVMTTLPANVPFYYKLDGNQKMLAITDINIGDEIEYIYAVKYIYDTPAAYFYKSNRIAFSGENYCIEKSVIFESNKYVTQIWPYNFTNGDTKDSDFSHKDGQKITLNNIPKTSDFLYTNDKLDQPYIYYIIAEKIKEKKYSVDHLLRDFKSRSKEIKKTEIFEGERIASLSKELEPVKSTKKRFEILLEKINAPIEDNSSYLYEDVRNDIEVAWFYAKSISKLMKSINTPIDFNFVVSKNYGTYDPNLISIHQFNNIIISFVDEKGIKHYMPLLEPYSNLDEIKSEFQETECFIISQSESGKRTYSNGRIPKTGAENSYSKNVEIELKTSNQDTLFAEVNENIAFKGDCWIDLKPYILHLLNDSLNTQRKLKNFIKNQIISSEKIDSVYNVKHTADATSFKFSYSYRTNHKISEHSDIINFQPDMFIENYFYTPYYQRSKRKHPGYLYDEFDQKYTISINLNKEFQWLENNLINDEFENSIGKIKSGYNEIDSKLNLSFSLDYKKQTFKVSEWNEMLELRDKSFNFLNGNLYFKSIPKSANSSD